MEAGMISKRYAKALIEYAQENDYMDELFKYFSILSHSFQKKPALSEALVNPLVSVDDKLALVCAATVGKEKASEEFVRFIRLILKNKREAYLQFISLMYLDLYRKLKHIGVGKLITAVPVDKGTEDRIRNSVSKVYDETVELETMVDPSIEGGFIFDMNDTRLDASIATQLKRVKQQFIEKNRRII